MLQNQPCRPLGAHVQLNLFISNPRVCFLNANSFKSGAIYLWCRCISQNLEFFANLNRSLFFASFFSFSFIGLLGSSSQANVNGSLYVTLAEMVKISKMRHLRNDLVFSNTLFIKRIS